MDVILSIGIVDCEGTIEWFEKTFPFACVPRIGETIWIGDSVGFKVSDVEHRFLSDYEPELRVELFADHQDMDWYEDKKEFLISWGFPVV